MNTINIFQRRFQRRNGDGKYIDNTKVGFALNVTYYFIIAFLNLNNIFKFFMIELLAENQ